MSEGREHRVGRLILEEVERPKPDVDYRGPAVARDQRIRTVPDEPGRLIDLPLSSLVVIAVLTGVAIFEVNRTLAFIAGLATAGALLWFRRRRKRASIAIDVDDEALRLGDRGYRLSDLEAVGVGLSRRGDKSSVWVRVAEGEREQIVDALEVEEAELVRVTIAEAIERAHHG